MRIFLLLLLGIVAASQVAAQSPEEQNKALARRFYEEVWFKPNLEFVDAVFAPTYAVHDIGRRKSVREPAAEQKEIAGFFWRNGEMSGQIQFQVAQGEYVATRWIWNFRLKVWWMRLLSGDVSIPIVNIMRFEDGKVVEIWNHRHDIDAAGPRFKLTFLMGFITGLFLWLVTAGVRRWRRSRGRTAHAADAL